MIAHLRRARSRGSDLGFVINDSGVGLERVGASFKSAATRAGLDDVTAHTMRHTACTWLSQKGLTPWEIAGWVGHKDIRTTMRYAHHHPEHNDKAVEAMG